MAYYFTRWRKSPRSEGYEPALPRVEGFGVIAQPTTGPFGPDGPDFCLVQCDYLPEKKRPQYLVEVPDELAELLDSAEQYPPAMAAMKTQVVLDNSKTYEEFAAALIARLRSHLRNQPTAPYFMAESIKTQPLYLEKGGYYWIVGYSGDNVYWVSRDYEIYVDPISYFAVSKVELKRRFGKKTRSFGDSRSGRKLSQ